MKRPSIPPLWVLSGPIPFVPKGPCCHCFSKSCVDPCRPDPQCHAVRSSSALLREQHFLRFLHCPMLPRLTALCKQCLSPCRVRRQHAARERQRLEQLRYDAQRPELLKAELQAAREAAQEREALRWRAAELGKVVAVASWVAHLRETLLRRRKQRQVGSVCMQWR